MWPASLPRHTLPTARRFYFIAAVALESKAALGLAIPYKATAENTTIYKRVEVMLDPSALERILCGGGATPGRRWVDAGATVALDPKVALGLAIPNRATAANTTTYTGAGDALGLRSWEQKLRGGQDDSWPPVD